MEHEGVKAREACYCKLHIKCFDGHGPCPDGWAAKDAVADMGGMNTPRDMPGDLESEDVPAAVGHDGLGAPSASAQTLVWKIGDTQGKQTTYLTKQQQRAAKSKVGIVPPGGPGRRPWLAGAVLPKAKNGKQTYWIVIVIISDTIGCSIIGCIQVLVDCK